MILIMRLQDGEYSALLAPHNRCSTRSEADARIAWFTHVALYAATCQWYSRSSKVDYFHFIWKGVCYFLL